MDEIVISGFSGKFPECENVEEFEKKLFCGDDMVTEDGQRWPAGIYGLPKRSGKLNDLSRFDATFFGVNPKQADAMDPQLRILIENVYESIIDAGYNPEELRGQKIGVFVGQSGNEAFDLSGRNRETLLGYGMSGSNRAMVANRISFTFDFKGPSLTIDAACSSSLVAFHLGVSAIQRGEINAAIVAGVNILLSPNTSLFLDRLNLLSKDGSCRTFDLSGDGYARSETTGAIFIQKSSDARRAYASVLGTGTNEDGYKELGITFPSGERKTVLINEVLNRGKVSPLDVTYVEAHGAGTKVGDSEEVNSLHDVFCSGVTRPSPLLIGSVSSNIGHAEAAASIGQLSKILLAMERGVIPGNLHFKEPNPDIPGLKDGSMKVVDKNLPWSGGIVSVNSFGFGGANANAVLKSNSKTKKNSTGNGGIPKLIVCSGRSEMAVEKILQKGKQFKDDDEFLALLHEIHKINIPGHPHRGFYLSGDQNTTIAETSPKREVWFVFSGMGSQWAGMGQQLMTLAPFSRGIAKCAKALAAVGVDLIGLINSNDESALTARNSFICIASIQVAMVDLLRELGVTPVGIVGHSAGELGCAYADEGFTAEETALAAHYRGLAIDSCNMTGGAMAAVAGLTWEQVKAKLPANVYAACHNSKDSVTISGKEEDVLGVLKRLEAEGITARPVNSSGIAFHSPYVSLASPALIESIKKINTVPKPRTKKWISSCVPSNLLNEPWAQMNSAEYHAFNVTSPVLFKQAIDQIPEGSIVVEIAPHALLGGLVKKSVPGSEVLSLAKKGIPDGVSFLLRTLGKLYNLGVAVDLRALYPPVEYPVSRGTPMLSSLIEWDHSTEWHVPLESNVSKKIGIFEQTIDLKVEEQKYLAGHVIDGRVLFPATGYLTLVWRAFAKLEGISFKYLPVVFSDVEIKRATVLTREGSVKLTVNIFNSSGKFEILDGATHVVTGRIEKLEDSDELMLADAVETRQSPGSKITADDVYKELALRRYEYSGEFRGIKNSDISGKSGRLQWSGNWITFMDTMLQFDILGNDTRELYLPVKMEKVLIDPKKHLESISVDGDVSVSSNKDLSIILSGGVVIRNLKNNHARKRPVAQAPPKLEKYVFVPYRNNKEMKIADAVTCALQIALENLESSAKIKIVEIANSPGRVLSPLIADVLLEEPNILADISVITDDPGSYSHLSEKQVKVLNQSLEVALSGNVNVVVAPDMMENMAVQENITAHLKPGCFIISKPNTKREIQGDLELVAEFPLKNELILLYRRNVCKGNLTVMKLDEGNFSWVEHVKDWLREHGDSDEKLLLISHRKNSSGIIGFFRCLRMENGKSIRVMLVPDEASLAHPSVRDQLQKGLAVNVLHKGAWGCYRHLKLTGSEVAADTQGAVISTQTEHAYVNTVVRGDLSSLRWTESPLSTSFSRGFAVDKELCTVYYAPLNFRDIMLATGKLPPDALPGNLTDQDCVLGLEFAGRDSAGRRVIGIVEACGMATSVAADKGFLWNVPEEWSLEEASTVPIVYTTAYYALIVRGNLQQGESVLIHAGSGGVGMAAISIALDMGCKVFTTVGTPSKKDFLLRKFHQLNSSMIGNSRNTSFEWMVLDGTSGKGVDVVLNSLAGELLQASVRCLAEGGRFLEIGKVDLSNNSALGMALFLKNTTFHGILLDALFQVGLENLEKAEVSRLMREGIQSGVVKPLPITVFKNSQLEEAFRYMATGKHIGKVVLKIRQEETEKLVEPPQEFVSALSKTYFDPGKSYVIVGGLGGFGLELVDWMVTRGATKLVLTSRSGITTGYQELCLRRWRAKSVEILISTIDCTTEDGAVKLLASANQLAPVGGIYNLAGVLRDGLFSELTDESFLAVWAPKVSATHWLDVCSRSACPHLDQFVAFSSVSCGRGNTGQANYGYSNSGLERICENRMEEGLPALAIQWGAVGDVGMVMKDLKGGDGTKVAGTLPQKIVSCLNTLDVFLGLSFGQKNLDGPRSPVVSSIVLADKGAFASSTSPAAATISSIVANIVGIKDVKNAGDTTLAELGMDSLMGTEIKQALEINLDLVMSQSDIRSLTFRKLAEMDRQEQKC